MAGKYVVLFWYRKDTENSLFPDYHYMKPPTFIDECIVREFRTMKEVASYLSYELREHSHTGWSEVYFEPDVKKSKELPF